jgi:hypothetical protein
MRKAVCAAALLGLLVACSSDKATGPNASITGNYTLSTVNGSTLPAVLVQDATEKDELTGGNVVLNADKTWSGNLALRGTLLATGQVATLNAPANGTYTNNNGAITLTETGATSQLVGTVGGGTLTVSGDLGTGATVTLVFKQ